MGRLLSLAAALCTVACGTAAAADWQLSIDTRLVASDGRRSFLDGGLGALRYGENRSGLELGRFRIGISEPIGSIVALHLDASSWGGYQKNPIDLTEAYLELRPYPRA